MALVVLETNFVRGRNAVLILAHILSRAGVHAPILGRFEDSSRLSLTGLGELQSERGFRLL